MEENNKLPHDKEQENGEQPQSADAEAGKEPDRSGLEAGGQEKLSFAGPEPAAAAEKETAPEEKAPAGESTAGWLSKLGEKITGTISRIPGLRRPLTKLGPVGTALGTITAGVLVLGLGTLLMTGGITGHTSAKVKPTPLKWILTYEDQTWEADLRKMGFDGKDPKTLDREKWEKWFEKVQKDVEISAVDARMERLGSPIEPEKEGKRIRVEEVEAWIANLPKGINKPRKLPVETLKPKVTAAQLEQVDQKRIGRYTTRYNPGEINRTTNVRLSSQAINNLVLSPGEEFSFNKTVGQRTAQRGYKNATVIVNGEFTDGMGGGICQTSSTLYNSVDHAGLEVTARFSHSKEVTYVPKGRDATVAWYGPDFKFRNSLSKPVLIKSTANGGYLTVEIFTSP
ncbi:VanW domain protein [Desmospora sp. 8437]|nr:VanW domain protein [Desmospora sp. 8437]